MQTHQKKHKKNDKYLRESLDSSSKNETIIAEVLKITHGNFPGISAD